MVGQLRVLGYLIDHVKKGNMVVSMDLDQKPIPLNSKLWYFVLFSLIVLGVKCQCIV